MRLFSALTDVWNALNQPDIYCDVASQPQTAAEASSRIESPSTTETIAMNRRESLQKMCPIPPNRLRNSIHSIRIENWNLGLGIGLDSMQIQSNPKQIQLQSNSTWKLIQFTSNPIQSAPTLRFFPTVAACKSAPLDMQISSSSRNYRLQSVRH